jgi:hypothetical protein
MQDRLERFPEPLDAKLKDNPAWDSWAARMDGWVDQACQVALQVRLLLVQQFLAAGQHWEFQE